MADEQKKKEVIQERASDFRAIASNGARVATAQQAMDDTVQLPGSNIIIEDGIYVLSPKEPFDSMSAIESNREIDWRS